MTSNRIFPALIAVLLAISLSTIPAATAQAEAGCTGAEKKKIVKKDSYGLHMEYTFQFSIDSNRYCVLVENKGEREFHSIFNAQVDGTTVAPEMPMIDPGESKYVERNITENLNVIKDNHSVELGVFQQTFVYNFTQELNATSPEVPAPTIRDVEIVRHEQNDSASLRVWVENPSDRGYSIYVHAKTFGTRRVDDIGAPQPNETVKYTLPLDEGSDAVVGGKVRIFDNWGEPESKFDQKEFLARPDNDTEMWDKPFEHMPGTESATAYDNETSKQYRAGYVNDDYLSEDESKIGAVAVVVVLVVAVWWRRRRKFR